MTSIPPSLYFSCLTVLCFIITNVLNVHNLSLKHPVSAATVFILFSWFHFLFVLPNYDQLEENKKKIIISLHHDERIHFIFYHSLFFKVYFDSNIATLLSYVNCLHKVSVLSFLPSRFSHVRLCATPWTAAYQASLSMGFSRQEHWSGLPFPSPVLSFYFQPIHAMLGWKNHKLESRLPGEISITSDMQMTPPLWQKVKRN